MFMQPDFIQKKFLDFDLTKFHFKDKIILNLVELKQLVSLTSIVVPLLDKNSTERALSTQSCFTRNIWLKCLNLALLAI